MKLQCEPRRIVLFGGSGLLGTAIRTVFGEEEIEISAPGHDQCDIRELDRVRAWIRHAGPELVVNAAAQAKVDLAEKSPDESFAINALGAHNLALAAAEQDVPLAHISSDYVFDGQRRTPYREHHATGEPANEYGRSKLQGELLVRHTWSRHFIVRVAALYGPGRPDFVDWILERANPDRPLTIVVDRFTTPTYTIDAARQLLALLKTPYYGTYHASGHGPASWFELARTALILAGRDERGVVPIPDAELVSSVRRPSFSALDNHLLRLRGLDTMRPWPEALAQYLGGHREEETQ